MVTRNPRILWVGDACVPTGFARVTHNVLAQLPGWDRFVLGVNYKGDPHPYQDLKIFPASQDGEDIFGISRIAAVHNAVQPDVVLVNNDPWNVPLYVQALRREKIDTPVVGYMPVDGQNVRAKLLNRLAHAIFYTEFGAREAVLGGYNGSYSIIPHGVDTELYRPLLQYVARERLGLHKSPLFPKGSFMVGCVNRNQPRKRLDLVLQYFGEWYRSIGKPDNVFLYCHCMAKGDRGWDLEQLAERWGFPKNLIVTARGQQAWVGVAEDSMPWIYNAMDVHVTATQGEGWGLTTQESMACGVPQIVPDYSALGEWVTGGAYRIQCTDFPVTPNDVNIIGGLPDKALFIAALQRAYEQPAERRRMGESARALVCRPEYRWSAVASMFDEDLRAVISREAQRREQVELSKSANDQPTGPRPVD